MEWIIGIIILWVLGSISGNSQDNESSTSNKSTYKYNEPNTPSVSPTPTKIQKESQKKFSQDKVKDLDTTTFRHLNKAQPVQKPPPKSSQGEVFELNDFLNQLDREYDLSQPYKDDWKEIQKIVEQNEITKLYHFTDRVNIPSIKKMGGLFSWQDLENMKVKIPVQGGNDLSKQLDAYKNLQNYVRLSFVENTPMLYFAKKEGRIQNPVILEIDPSIIFLKDTIYSDGNATSNQAHIGGDLQTFKKINFSVINKRRWDGDEEKHYLQAEVLVKKSVPLNFIKNL